MLASLVPLLGWSLVAGFMLVVLARPIRVLAGLVEWEGNGRKLTIGDPRAIATLGSIGVLAVAFWGGATVVSIGGGATAGGSGSATPNAPVVSGLATIVVDTSTLRATYIVTPAGGSAHDSTRIRIRRLGGTVLIDSIFGGAVLDKTVASNDSLKADTTYVAGVMARATNGAGWSAEVFDTLVNTASTWPNNEPSGMTLITSTDGSDKYFGTGGSGTGWFFGPAYNSSVYTENVTDATSRYGTVITKVPGIGAVAGWNGLAQYLWNGTEGAFETVYFRTIYRASSNYQICGADEKPFGYLGSTLGGDGADVYINMQSNGSWTLHNELNGAGFNNPNLNYTWADGGDYITLEIVLVAESSASGSDGEYHFYVDDDLIASDDNLNWGTGTPGWNAVNVFNYWGGSSCTKTVQDTLFISEIYVSGKN